MSEHSSDAGDVADIRDASTVIDSGATSRRWEFKCRNAHSEKAASGKAIWEVKGSAVPPNPRPVIHKVEADFSGLEPGEIYDSEESFNGIRSDSLFFRCDRCFYES